MNTLVVIDMIGLLEDLDRQDVKDFLNRGVDFTADLGNDIYDSFSRGTAYDDFMAYLGGLFDDDEPRSVMREIEYSQPMAGSGPYPGMAPMRSTGPYPGMITRTTIEKVAPEKPKVEIEDVSPFMGTEYGYSKESSSQSGFGKGPKGVQYTAPVRMDGAPPLVRSPEAKQLAEFARRNQRLGATYPMAEEMVRPFPMRQGTDTSRLLLEAEERLRQSQSPRVMPTNPNMFIDNATFMEQELLRGLLQ